MFLNAFERSVQVNGWSETQWAAIFFPCLIGPIQLAVDTLPMEEVVNYKRVCEAILQTKRISKIISNMENEVHYNFIFFPLNLSPETYQQ